MNLRTHVAIFLLRISISFGFLSAVASRFGLWGKYSSGWSKFVEYTGQVNSFAPKLIIPTLAIVATVTEIAVGFLLLIGYKTRCAALVASVLTLLFALTMAYSFGIKDPLDYAVFVVSAGSFVLTSVTHYRWSIDEAISKF